MAERRRFNSREKAALYLAADGRCSRCGDELERGWHADHVQPHSKGGPTAISNGRALCPACNLTKGNRVAYIDTFQPRRFQRDVIQAVLDGVASKRPVTIALAGPGSGKTLAWQATATHLYREGLIDHVAVFVPRTILAQQSELTWMATDPTTGEVTGDHMLFDARFRLGAIRHVPNVTPLLPPGRHGNGLATTYSSLAEAAGTYRDFFEQKMGRVLLVVDEAQFCGDSRDGRSGGTKAGSLVRELSDLAAHTLMLTGTPYRSDDAPLILADYSEPDEKGQKRLLAHVEATYADGVADGYLRGFEFTLQEIRVERKYLDGRTLGYDISSDGSDLREVLRRPHVWQGVADRVATAVRRKQRAHPDYCGLIACMEQGDAKRVADYLRATHPGLRVAVALSDDGAEAKRALRSFRATDRDGRRTAPVDILVTVRMAFIGYDCPQITVIGLLTHYRDWGHLEQLVGRGLRVWKGLPASGQSCLAVAPDDPACQAFVEYLAGQSKNGLKERENRDSDPGTGSGSGPEPGGDLFWVESAEPTTVRAVSADAEVDDDRHMAIESLRTELGLTDDITKLAKLAERLGSWLPGSPEAAVPSQAAPVAGGGVPKTMREQVDDINVEAAEEIRNALTAVGVFPQRPDYRDQIAKATRLVNERAGYKAKDCKEPAHAQARLDAARRMRLVAP